MSEGTTDRIRLGVSSCLLGDKVRFDGGHKRSAFLAETLEPFVEWVPLCPEVGAGLSSPRPALRLVARDNGVRIEERKSGADHTNAITSWSERAVSRLESADLDGYVLVKGSPSCGLERVRIYDGNGNQKSQGSGVFAAALTGSFPDLPVEEEGRLRDAGLREAFFERVFARRRLSTLAGDRRGVSVLVAFHAAHKIKLMSHSPEGAREMGRVVARARQDIDAAFARYGELFGRVLSRPTQRGRHVNALQHGAGFLKRLMSAPARADLRDAISDYASGSVPLVVPVTLLAHRARDEGLDYLTSQTYLDPYPAALGLRSAV